VFSDVEDHRERTAKSSHSGESRELSKSTMEVDDMAMTAAGKQATTTSSARWVQLILGIVGMVAIANLQYGWTLFVNPIDSKFHWGRAAIQVAFTLFVVAETWLVPFEGYLVDRRGINALAQDPVLAKGHVFG
jgi:hypothetical protein